MGKSAKFSNEKTKESKKGFYAQLKKAIGIVIMAFYHLRKIILAIPVAYAAFRIALYNGEHLPVEVGLFLQNNGDFLQMVDRNFAVFWPLVITLGCLFLMFFSRKALYAWAISVFTLALPLLLLFSNIYPS